jgi:lipid II:glycine glycyltransferase (peptidoglycan interpeptide bridge formation enzyme)
VCTEWNQQLHDTVKAFYKPIAKRLGCTFIRLDNDVISGSTQLRPIAAKLARTASLQPRSEWVLDITPDNDALWSGFHKHARYNVRLAERANADIQIYEPAEAPLEDFFSLMQATGSRDRFGIFDRSYYESYLQTLSAEDGFVVACSIGGKPAAAGLFVVYDKQAHYVFAGSSNDFRKIAPAYAVIWHALQEAKRRGCTRFNFGGIVDEVKSQDLSGVTAFKKRFGGYVVNHPNPIDIVYKPARYFMFKLYKSLR